MVVIEKQDYKLQLLMVALSSCSPSILWSSIRQLLVAPFAESVKIAFTTIKHWVLSANSFLSATFRTHFDRTSWHPPLIFSLHFITSIFVVVASVVMLQFTPIFHAMKTNFVVAVTIYTFKKRTRAAIVTGRAIGLGCNTDHLVGFFIELKINIIVNFFLASRLPWCWPCWLGWFICFIRRHFCYSNVNWNWNWILSPNHDAIIVFLFWPIFQPSHLKTLLFSCSLG